MHNPDPFDAQEYYEQELVENRAYYVGIACAILPFDGEDVVGDLYLSVRGWPPGRADAYWAKEPAERSARALLTRATKNLAFKRIRRRKKQVDLVSPNSSEDDPFADVQRFDALPDPASLEGRPEEASEEARRSLSEAEDCFTRIFATGKKRAIQVLRAFALLAAKLGVMRPKDQEILDHLNGHLAPGEEPFKATSVRVQLNQGRRALIDCMTDKGLSTKF